jgi:hypothetical protein
MRGSTIDNEKDRSLSARDQAFQELDIMLWRAPVAATIGVSPRLPQLRPAW